jgi:predicted protein tyrosine phosphatase
MFKDKTYQTMLNWYYGDLKNVERIYKEKETIYNHFYKLSVPMTPIIDNLILGNACDASFYYRLEKANIGAIINVTKEIPNYFKGEFSYFNISLNDQNHDNFTNTQFKEVIEFIESVPKEQNILIHCYMGSSRSATVIAAYMINKYGYSIDKCIELLRKKREIVNINKQFISNLEDYSLSLSLSLNSELSASNVSSKSPPPDN